MKRILLILFILFIFLTGCNERVHYPFKEQNLSYNSSLMNNVKLNITAKPHISFSNYTKYILVYHGKHADFYVDEFGYLHNNSPPESNMTLRLFYFSFESNITYNSTEFKAFDIWNLSRD